MNTTIEYRTEFGVDHLVIGNGLMFARHDGALFYYDNEAKRWVELAPIPDSDRAKEIEWMVEPMEDEPFPEPVEDETV